MRRRPTPRLRIEIDQIPPSIHWLVKTAARHEGVSVRALTLRLWKEWATSVLRPPRRGRPPAWTNRLLQLRLQVRGPVFYACGMAAGQLYRLSTGVRVTEPDARERAQARLLVIQAELRDAIAVAAAATAPVLQEE